MDQVTVQTLLEGKQRARAAPAGGQDTGSSSSVLAAAATVGSAGTVSASSTPRSVPAGPAWGWEIYTQQKPTLREKPPTFRTPPGSTGLGTPVPVRLSSLRAVPSA